MIYNLSITIHVFLMLMLIYLLVDEILLPRYVNLSTIFRGLWYKVEIASCLKSWILFYCIHVTNIYIHQLCVDTGCSLKDLPKVCSLFLLEGNNYRKYFFYFKEREPSQSWWRNQWWRRCAQSCFCYCF